MNVSLNANDCDIQTKELLFKLKEPLEKLSQYLSKDFGGEMENLWIDLELSSMEAQFTEPLPFRFQKRVSGKSNPYFSAVFPDRYNVGHYSVRPDFKKLQEVSDPIKYILEVIYDSTEILIEKGKKFQGFDSELFRSEFLIGCEEIGYTVKN